MATYRGFVRSLQVREDGWVEFALEAVHAGNTTKTFFIEDLDGSLDDVHRRLGQLSLLRDALARVLPVEAEYTDDPEKGTLVEDLTVYPRPSIEGREGTRRVEGVVIGLSITERGPETGSSPYVDEADVCAVTLLEDDGTLDLLMLDLQRPDPLTAQSILALLRKALRTRRPVALVATVEGKEQQTVYRMADVAAAAEQDVGPGWIQTCEWLVVPTADLDEVHCFIERLGQRYESYLEDEAPALSHVRVTYTTAPAQTPEGDVSENGSFVPATTDAWVHDDSPLLEKLEAALRDRLMVILGLDDDQIHSVDLIGHLGSAARPIWIKTDRRALPPEQARELCENVPTIQTPGAEAFDEIPVAVAWLGHGYFNEGIWRFVLTTQAKAELRIDGKPCGCGEPTTTLDWSVTQEDTVGRQGEGQICHAYLRGMHRIEVILSGRRCCEPFQLRVYRIR
jgi:hypothetical protein